MTTDKDELILEVDGADLGVEEALRGVAMFMAANPDGPRVVLSTAHPLEVREKAERILPPGANFEILQAPDELPERIESPVKLIREKRENPVAVAMRRAKGNPQAVVISPAHTGLVMATALFTLGRLKGIDRPPIGVPFPIKDAPFLLVDGGSNVDVRPEHLLQFALLAKVYVNLIWGRENPRVGLLSNGTEEYKGNELVREAYPLLDRDPRINFVGFVEANTIFQGGVDVVVCDGFVGNILLKASEGMGRAVISAIAREFRRRPLVAMLAKLVLAGFFKELRASMDYSQYGGAPLLGVEGNVIICHGRSNAKAFQNALRVGRELVESEILKRMRESLKSASTSQEGGTGS